jgi:hypothetical protein
MTGLVVVTTGDVVRLVVVRVELDLDVVVLLEMLIELVVLPDEEMVPVSLMSLEEAPT